MAKLIWTEPALADLEAVADYIALDKPDAASRYVRRVFDRMEQLAVFPYAGKTPPEFVNTRYREVVLSPCRIFYRVEGESVFVLHVMRAERLLRQFLLDERNRKI